MEVSEIVGRVLTYGLLSGFSIALLDILIKVHRKDKNK